MLLCWCFTALQHLSGHFGRGQLTYPQCSWASLLGSLPVLSAHYFASNASVICNHGPHGAGDSGDIAGLKCHILTSASSPQCGGTAGLLIPCQTCRGNFLFTCRDLSRAFHRALTIDMSPQCWAYTRALQRQKSISPLFPGPTVAVVTNDCA